MSRAGKTKDAVRQGIPAVMVVKEPTIELRISQGCLNLIELHNLLSVEQR